MSVSHDHAVAPVGQKRKVSGSPRCRYASLVTATWAWAKELKACLSAGHISVSMSSKSKEKDLQPNSFTWQQENGDSLGLRNKTLLGSSNKFRMSCSELSRIYYSTWNWSCSSISSVSSLLPYLCALNLLLQLRVSYKSSVNPQRVVKLNTAKIKLSLLLHPSNKVPPDPVSSSGQQPLWGWKTWCPDQERWRRWIRRCAAWLLISGRWVVLGKEGEIRNKAALLGVEVKRCTRSDWWAQPLQVAVQR